MSSASHRRCQASQQRCHRRAIRIGKINFKALREPKGVRDVADVTPSARGDHTDGTLTAWTMTPL